MVRNRKNNDNRRTKRLINQASGMLPKTKRTKLQNKEEQLQTSCVENDLLYYAPVVSNGEFLHNGDSLLDFGFNFDDNDNKENDYTNLG